MLFFFRFDHVVIDVRDRRNKRGSKQWNISVQQTFNEGMGDAIATLLYINGYCWLCTIEHTLISTIAFNNCLLHAHPTSQSPTICRSVIIWRLPANSGATCITGDLVNFYFCTDPPPPQSPKNLQLNEFKIICTGACIHTTSGVLSPLVAVGTRPSYL